MFKKSFIRHAWLTSLTILLSSFKFRAQRVLQISTLAAVRVQITIYSFRLEVCADCADNVLDVSVSWAWSFRELGGGDNLIYVIYISSILKILCK
ncbi:hypothetical protein R1flu_007822 [Riccia fluitans]|uniref:Secreted protein n=1 Tax=Riccia fluitans TaxID=41844 RepID=A0ABD1Z058_9MARC